MHLCARAAVAAASHPIPSHHRGPAAQAPPPMPARRCWLATVSLLTCVLCAALHCVGAAPQNAMQLLGLPHACMHVCPCMHAWMQRDEFLVVRLLVGAGVGDNFHDNDLVLISKDNPEVRGRVVLGPWWPGHVHHQALHEAL